MVCYDLSFENHTNELKKYGMEINISAAGLDFHLWNDEAVVILQRSYTIRFIVWLFLHAHIHVDQNTVAAPILVHVGEVYICTSTFVQLLQASNFTKAKTMVSVALVLALVPIPSIWWNFRPATATCTKAQCILKSKLTQIAQAVFAYFKS